VSSHLGAYPHHTDQIICPKCGQKGIVLWEDIPRGDGIQKEMVKIDGGFYERLSKKAPYPIELVCDGCGTAQPEERLQP
jgi:hypothetical protein